MTPKFLEELISADAPGGHEDFPQLQDHHRYIPPEDPEPVISAIIPCTATMRVDMSLEDMRFGRGPDSSKAEISIYGEWESTPLLWYHRSFFWGQKELDEFWEDEIAAFLEFLQRQALAENSTMYCQRDLPRLTVTSTIPFEFRPGDRWR